MCELLRDSASLFLSQDREREKNDDVRMLCVSETTDIVAPRRARMKNASASLKCARVRSRRREKRDPSSLARVISFFDLTEHEDVVCTTWASTYISRTFRIHTTRSHTH